MMETECLILRAWRESDAPALFKYARDPQVGPRAGWPTHKSVEKSLEIIMTVLGQGPVHRGYERCENTLPMLSIAFDASLFLKNELIS